jgi:hypothetical protein
VRKTPEQTVVGWREWVTLPDCGVDWIKAKLDTGARTSSLHAHHLRVVDRDGEHWAEFDVHPWQRSTVDAVHCAARVIDERTVRSSTGHEDRRIVVRLSMRLAGVTLLPEVTLTRRDEMGFRLLVGRQALRPAFLVDSSRSYLGGRPPREVRRLNRREVAG